MTKETFPLTIDRTAAWLVQKAVQPSITLPEEMDGTPVYVWQKNARALREKINNTILRFEDEPETDEVIIEIARDEAWILDQVLPFDQSDTHVDILLQVFRGLWHLDNNILPMTIVNEPEVPTQQQVKEMLDSHFGGNLTLT